MRKTANETGRSVIELVMVAGLLGILVTGGLYSVRRAAAREEADGWVRAIVYDIAAGQQAAITRRTTVAAVFQDRTYVIAAIGGGIIRQDTLPAHMTFGPLPRTLTFDRRGIPAGDLTVNLASPATGRSYTITVEPETGRVSYREP
ncbi:MAG: hypothetical protein QN168_12515 [Armatimonadota bacterium]|nr:hypothetical protein [Armatimonadota bacterium]